MNLRLIKPLDQPLNTYRLLPRLIDALTNNEFDQFSIIVAYAKSGPLNRLESHLRAWSSAGKSLRAIIGIDQKGTSLEALIMAMRLFDEVYITQESGITFHPKIYFFEGSKSSRAYVGSHNFTVGGTETNFESAIEMELDMPVDQQVVDQFRDAWNELLPPNCPATFRLSPSVLLNLVRTGLVLRERSMGIRSGHAASGGSPSGTLGAPTSTLPVVPPSALPKPKRQVARSKKAVQAKSSGAKKKVAVYNPGVSKTATKFVIQIKPHHNGEVFLSVTAALQNPSFFKWPFNGQTTPKKPGNPTYPQLDPDPVVDIVVYGAGATPVLTLNGYDLNTVYYEKKSEIRITVSPVVGIVPDYSVMIMEKNSTTGIDYKIEIHTPASPHYGMWVAACNQQMPGGGKNPRKFGWF